MQIIPSKNSSSPLGDELFSQAGLETSVGEAFAEYLQSYFEALGDVAAGKESSVQNALDTNAPLAEAPYSRNTLNGVTYTMDEVCFTKQELGELRQNLVNAGAPEESLSEFDKLAQQPDGATLGQVVSSLQGNTQAPALSEEERDAIKGLTDRIDPTGALGETVMGHLEKGESLEAWNAISRALHQLGPNTTVSLHKDEIATLSKALGISDAAMRKTLSAFGPYGALELTGADAQRLMNPIQHDLMSRKGGQEKLEAALDKTLRPILQKAKDRMESERKATAHSDRSAEQSKVMIERTVKTQANQTIEGAAVGDARDALLKSGDLADQLQNMLKDQAQNKAHPQDAAQQGVDQQLQQHRQGGMGMRDGKSHDGMPQSGKSKSDPLLGKIDVRPSAVTATTFANPLQAATQQMHAGKTADTQQISRQAASQVEQAMLSALRDGTKRLELQLDPSDLGQLSLILTARNGEISATIRTERTETAEMMHRQLDIIRANLEQQGIKVDKLEVQTQLADNNQQQWQGLNQHNAQQEEHARREQMERLRILRTLRNSSDISGKALLEQGVQLSMQSAGNAAQSLHIIA